MIELPVWLVIVIFSVLGVVVILLALATIAIVVGFRSGAKRRREREAHTRDHQGGSPRG